MIETVLFFTSLLSLYIISLVENTFGCILQRLAKMNSDF